MAGEDNQDIQDAYAGEIEAFVGDIERMKQEAATAATAAKDIEIQQLQTQLTESRKVGAGGMLAILKSKLGIF